MTQDIHIPVAANDTVVDASVSPAVLEMLSAVHEKAGWIIDLEARETNLVRIWLWGLHSILMEIIGGESDEVLCQRAAQLTADVARFRALSAIDPHASLEAANDNAPSKAAA